MANSDCLLVKQQEMLKLRFPLQQARFLCLVRLHHSCANHSKQGILGVTNQEVPGGYNRKLPSHGKSSHPDKQLHSRFCFNLNFTSPSPIATCENGLENPLA
jgi:hypothetical protein